ncbi:hypothetical protein Y1Q_0007728 [Alligator mississippiensis]|uniref:Uncharacterized protein n=1 Tax=Alligator mississippiensis TaxID=8496 RepID=A0A151NKN7_ALLMI|nr:hypothetical protein Y1Q_0007728 [Alligator mississippiensis]
MLFGHHLPSSSLQFNRTEQRGFEPGKGTDGDPSPPQLNGNCSRSPPCGPRPEARRHLGYSGGAVRTGVLEICS